MNNQILKMKKKIHWKDLRKAGPGERMTMTFNITKANTIHVNHHHHHQNNNNNKKTPKEKREKEKKEEKKTEQRNRDLFTSHII